jgi:predicted tellurium resistance membrane protein TerC
VQRYPPLVDGAFIIIAWVGVKLLISTCQIHYLEFECRGGCRWA